MQVAAMIHGVVQSLEHWLQFWLFTTESRWSGLFLLLKGKKNKEIQPLKWERNIQHFKVKGIRRKPVKVLLFMPVGPCYEITALHLPSPFAVFPSMVWLKAGSRAVGGSTHTDRIKKLKHFPWSEGAGVFTEDRKMFNLKCGESKTGCAHL